MEPGLLSWAEVSPEGGGGFEPGAERRAGVSCVYRPPYRLLGGALNGRVCYSQGRENSGQPVGSSALGLP